MADIGDARRASGFGVEVVKKDAGIVEESFEDEVVAVNGWALTGTLAGAGLLRDQVVDLHVAARVDPDKATVVETAAVSK